MPFLFVGEAGVRNEHKEKNNVYPVVDKYIFRT